MAKPELTLKEQAQILEAVANALEKEYGLENVDAKKTAEDFQASMDSPAYARFTSAQLKSMLKYGKYAELQTLCRQLANKNVSAQDIYGYAHALNGYTQVPLVNVNCIIRGLAHSGYTHEVNILIAEAEDHYRAAMNAEAGYREGGYFDNDARKLRILALTEDEKVQLVFAHPAFRQDLYTIQNNAVDPQVTRGLELLREAKAIKSNMSAYHLNYEQALEFRDRLASLKQERQGGPVKSFFYQFFNGHPYQEGLLQHIKDRLVLADEIRKRDESKTNLGMK